MPRITTATKTVRSTKTAAAKKPAVKRPAAKKVVAKKPVRKPVAAKRVKAEIAVTPNKYTFSKATLLQELTDRAGDSEVTLKQTKAVMQALEDLILGSVHKRGCGEFSMPGLFKIVTRKVAARKGGQTKISPFTKEEYVTSAKPATVKVRVRTGAKLKQVAVQ